MRTFDHDYVNEIVARLGRLKADAKPRWGAMSRDQMTGHLAFWVRYSMGKETALPFVGNAFTKHIVAPLLLNGWLPIPNNLKNPKLDSLMPEQAACDTETLHAVLETYLDWVQSGELTPHDHPAFGAIGVDGWAKMHMVHFEHHLKQFGV